MTLPTAPWRNTLKRRPRHRVSTNRSHIGRVTIAVFSALVIAIALAGGAGPALAAPVRVADVRDGHVHPALTRTNSGQLLAVFNPSGGGGKELLLCRSENGGRTWSPPVSVTGPADNLIYPGSLTTLRDGRILLNWSLYRPELRRKTPIADYREPRYSLSRDEGHTWSPARTYPMEKLTLYTCLRNPVVELASGEWVLPFYDRTVQYDPVRKVATPWGDGRNHGMVPLVRTPRGTLLSGSPEVDSPVPGGKPKQPTGGLRSTDGGKSWQPLHAFPRFGVAGYDLLVLRDGTNLLTAIDYGGSDGGEIAIRLIASTDDGVTWPLDRSVVIHDPGRRIKGRGWPRTVQVDAETLGTLFYDLDPGQPSGPGLFFIRTPIAALRRP